MGRILCSTGTKEKHSRPGCRLARPRAEHQRHEVHRPMGVFMRAIQVRLTAAGSPRKASASSTSTRPGRRSRLRPPLPRFIADHVQRRRLEQAEAAEQVRWVCVGGHRLRFVAGVRCQRPGENHEVKLTKPTLSWKQKSGTQRSARVAILRSTRPANYVTHPSSDRVSARFP